MAWHMMDQIIFALLLNAVAVSGVNVTENVTLPGCDTIPSMAVCSDTCKAVYEGAGSFSFSYRDCKCQTRVDGVSVSCCDTDFCPTTTTTKARVTCYSLPSLDDCIQACEDQYGDASSFSVVFVHRESCTAATYGSCCDGTDGARALSVLPAAMISMSLLVARFF